MREIYDIAEVPPGVLEKEREEGKKEVEAKLVLIGRGIGDGEEVRRRFGEALERGMGEEEEENKREKTVEVEKVESEGSEEAGSEEEETDDGEEEEK